MKRRILRFGKNKVIWLLNQRWFRWLLNQQWLVNLWGGCFGVKIVQLPAFALRDVTPAQMIDIPDIQVTQKYHNHLLDCFQQIKPAHDDKKPIAVRVIDDAVTIAGMPFYISDDKIWLCDNFDFDIGDITSHSNFLYRLPISPFYCALQDRQIALSARYLQANTVIDKGISLLPAFNNYWHFMFEQAPKILLSDMAGIPDDVPLLLPDDLHKNLYEIVDLLNQGKREIISLPILHQREMLRPKNNKAVKINKLYHIADISNSHVYSKIDMMSSSENHQHHMQCNAIKLLVKQLLQRCDIMPESDERQKLFILRNSRSRIAKDQAQLKDYLITKGFIIFEPEKHSFAEQVKICARASVIVGYAGAAWTNTLFMPADSKKILLMNSSGKSHVAMWDLLLENFYVLENAFTPRYQGDPHGTPYLSEKNWKDLEEIISQT